MAPPRVLVVEDEQDIAGLIKHTLERSGDASVEIAGRGDDALRLIAARMPDLVILDLNLPGLGGDDVCRMLRQRTETANLPIIMLTARTSETDRVAGLDLGADDYVTKPFSLRELGARVRAVLRRRVRPADEGRQAKHQGKHLVADFDAVVPEVRDRPDAIPFAGPVESVRFEDVSFRYGSGSLVLDGLSIKVEAGQRVGIVGPSGAGKTTVISLVARFYDPVGGRVLLNGRDLRDYRLADVYRHVAIVTQDPFVFSATVRENIRYGSPGATDNLVEAAARAADVHEDIVALADGYDTVLGVGGRLLSGGQMQRLNIARALLKNAPLLVLDEAT